MLPSDPGLLHRFINTVVRDSNENTQLEKHIRLYVNMMREQKLNCDRGKLIQHLLVYDTKQHLNTLQNFILRKYEYYAKHFREEKITQQYYVHSDYFYWVNDLFMEDDFRYRTPRGDIQYIHLCEYIYLTYRITQHLIHKDGYAMISRNYFCGGDKSIRDNYYKFTQSYLNRGKTTRKKRKVAGKHLTSNKYVFMLKVLDMRDIIRVFRQGNAPSVFAIGELNPYNLIPGVMNEHQKDELLKKYGVDYHEREKQATQEHEQQEVDYINSKPTLDEMIDKY
jgi:hypothetical protein